MSENYLRGDDDLLEAIQHQLEFIETSSRLFDGGDTEEAVRIATALNVILEKKGLLYHLLKDNSNHIQLLSTVDFEVPEYEKLKIICVKNEVEIEAFSKAYFEEIKSDESIFLIYVKDKNSWLVFAQDINKNIIKSYIDEFEKKYKGKILFINYLENDTTNLPVSAKCHIFNDLKRFLGYRIKYISPNSLVMVNDDITSLQPLLDQSRIKNDLSLDKWLSQEIYCACDSVDSILYLSREKLIKTIRDKDGGAHFDATLNKKSTAYIIAKRKITLFIDNDDNEFGVENYPLKMMRQIAYEFLNSNIIDQIKKIKDF